MNVHHLKRSWGWSFWAALAIGLTFPVSGIATPPNPHDADLNGDYVISYEELQQVVELWAAGAYYVDTSGRYVAGRNPASSTPAQTITIPLTLPAGATPLLMKQITATSFIMGSSAEERGRYNGEWLPHPVAFTKNFTMGIYEVTQAQWRAVMGTNPSLFRGDNRPVENVTWFDCVRFCNRLSRLQGKTPVYNEVNWIANLSANGFRLPTEAEWEYACRAGTTTRFFHGDVLTLDDGCAPDTPHDPYMWWCGNAGNQTHDVGLKSPNARGLYDMHGNVWEWCQDWWVYPYNRGFQVDPIGQPSGSYRVFRGGGWDSNARLCRSAVRTGGVPYYRSDYLGFRVVQYP